MTVAAARPPVPRITAHPDLCDTQEGVRQPCRSAATRRSARFRAVRAAARVPPDPCPPIGGHAGRPAHGPIRRLCRPAVQGIVSGVGQRARQTGRRDRDRPPCPPLRPHPHRLPRRRRHPPHAAADRHPGPPHYRPRRRPQPRLRGPRPRLRRRRATTSPSATPPAPRSTPRSCGPAAWPPPPSPRSSAWSAPSSSGSCSSTPRSAPPPPTPSAPRTPGCSVCSPASPALAATGVAHLLIVSTPDPLSYLGWIIGLSTAAAVVLPLLGGVPLAAAIAVAVVNLVIGLAIGGLVIGTAMAARRPATR